MDFNKVLLDTYQQGYNDAIEESAEWSKLEYQKCYDLGKEHMLFMIKSAVADMFEEKANLTEKDIEWFFSLMIMFNDAEVELF